MNAQKLGLLLTSLVAPLGMTAFASDGGAASARSTPSPVGTGFTYQGQLKHVGVPGSKWPAPSASVANGPRLWWSSLGQWFPDTCNERRLRQRKPFGTAWAFHGSYLSTGPSQTSSG